jgi:UDPglucose 6-dehydrogenase/UDP-N-acetyl-D-galactosamine dehydrogenase
VEELQEFGVEVYGHNPLLSKKEIENFGISVFKEKIKVDGNILNVMHDKFKKIGLNSLKMIMNNKPLLIDVKGNIKI